MSKNIEDKEDSGWALSIGLYPGILMGVRTYDFEDSKMHVLYIPFIDFVLEFKK